MVWTRTRILAGITSSHAGAERSPASARATMNGVSSVDPACLLLLPDLEQVLALLRPVAAMFTGRVRPDLNGALGRVAFGALEEQLHLLAAAQLAVRACVSRHMPVTPQTRRRFGGRQPLCGTGVTS